MMDLKTSYKTTLTAARVPPIRIIKKPLRPPDMPHRVGSCVKELQRCSTNQLQFKKKKKYFRHQNKGNDKNGHPGPLSHAAINIKRDFLYFGEVEVGGTGRTLKAVRSRKNARPHVSAGAVAERSAPAWKRTQTWAQAFLLHSHFFFPLYV